MMVGLLGAPSAFAVKPTQPLEASFKLKSSNHYAISGFGIGGCCGSFASLTASGDHGSSQYFGQHGQDSGFGNQKRMVSDLGSRGGYELRFHRKKTKMIDPPNGCPGKPAKAWIGVWKGQINFRGEGGYTSVHATRAHGRVVPKHSWWPPCYHQVKGTFLDFYGEGPSPGFPTLHFTALKPDGGATPTFTALLASEPVPATGATVTARRQVAVNGTSGQFTFNDALTSAQVNPPAPFSGSPSCSDPNGAPGYDHWSGSLAVDFPGHPDYAISMPGWTSGGCVAHGKFIQPPDPPPSHRPLATASALREKQK
jgi:hypothetical protein